MTSEIDHIVGSERYRLQTFDSLPQFPSLTRRQLALAGFLYRQSECVCSQCGVTIDLQYVDENVEYAAHYFRKLHRKKVVHLGKRCSFLLCESGTNIDDLHPSFSSSSQPPSWDDAEEPEYINYTQRLQSFESHEQFQLTQQTMAKHGFFFSGPRDGVTCFYCGNTLVDWSRAMAASNANIVQLEHARFFPCRFVTYTAGGKFVANAGYFHTVSAQERRDRNPMTFKPPKTPELNETRPRTIDECLATFAHWPRYAPVSAQALADTGFYYLGEELRVKCFMCDLEVDDWRHGMTALGTHRRRKNDCEIVRALDSIKSGDIQTINEKWRLETLHGLSFAESNAPEVDRRLCRELAACGFYRFKNTRTIRCAYCGVTIEPKAGQSIMFQHRQLTKQAVKRTTNSLTTAELSNSHAVDCLMVRAQCPSNIAIPHRERFPEYAAYQSIFDRLNSFENHRERPRTGGDYPVRDMAEAGLFLDEQKRIRCFQCGNSLILNSRTRREKYPQYNIAQLHAHFYPTCEWVKEILGVKYIAQVLHDRYKSDEVQTPSSVSSQASSSVTTTPQVLDLTSPTFTPRTGIDEPIDSDVSAEESDDEGFEPVAPPPKTEIMSPSLAARSPLLTHELSSTATTANAETCSDPTSNGHRQLINPFEQLLRQQQRNEQINDIISVHDPHPDHSPPPPPVSSPPPFSSPVDIRSLLAHESNRLDTFKKQDRETFGQVSVQHLAYVGFYLNGEGTRIQCPWCEVQLTELQFEEIMRARPAVTRSSISEEPWTPMRVHRHANGIIMDQNHHWCTWVRREAGGLYPNVTMIESQMLYPEYPLYANIERRIRSFTSDWPYPSGSRLSNQMMAEAGFFNMGGGNVCCYYCGNKLQNFEPRDCPFEEHATFYPFCDFIQKVRGLDYVTRIILECGRTPQGRLKYEMDGAQRIKRIVFDKSGATKRKSERPPVNRINSTSTRAIPTVEIDDNACLICSGNPATYEYTPCQHMPMCGECYARLDQEQHQKCMHCFKPAKISMRVPNTPLLQ